MPRPRIMTDVNQQLVCGIVAAGATIERAARYIGCTKRTVLAEAKRNPEFREALRKADVEGSLTVLRNFGNAARGNWRAAQWFLQQRFPKSFARR